MWKAADINNDGVLDSKEWNAFSHPEEHPSMLPIILEQTLREKDKDGDRFISFQEFVGDRAEEHDKDWLQVEKDKFDSDLDKDGDGKLSSNEILSWVVPSNEWVATIVVYFFFNSIHREIAEEEVQHLFASSDDDHDELLSFDEVLEHHDTFVGSEATDYGDHLHNIQHFEDELWYLANFIVICIRVILECICFGISSVFIVNFIYL